VRVALGVLVVAAAVAVWSLVRAVRIDPVPDVPPPTLASAGMIGTPLARSRVDIQDAVDNDPFSPDRTTSAPYRLPGEPDPNANPVAEPEKPNLVGTAVSADGRSFAVLQMGDGRTVSRYVGDTIGVFRVKTIERSRVVLTAPSGKRVDVNAIKPER
jgi:hypothetical protein